MLTDNSKDELWIAYVTDKSVSNSKMISAKLEYKDIEMMVTVSTASGLPFSRQP